MPRTYVHIGHESGPHASLVHGLAQAYGANVVTQVPPAPKGRSRFLTRAGFCSQMLRWYSPTALVVHDDKLIQPALRAVRGTRAKLIVHRYMRTAPPLGMFRSPEYRRVAGFVVNSVDSDIGLRAAIPAAMIKIFQPPIDRPIDGSLSNAIGFPKVNFAQIRMGDVVNTLRMLRASTDREFLLEDGAIVEALGDERAQTSSWYAISRCKHVIFMTGQKLAYPTPLLTPASYGCAVAAPAQSGYDWIEGVEWYSSRAPNHLVDFVKVDPPGTTREFGDDYEVLMAHYRSMSR